MTQPATYHCDVCGQTVAVQRVTAYEFTAPCKCDRWISWDHRNKPPAFASVLAQGELF